MPRQIMVNAPLSGGVLCMKRPGFHVIRGVRRAVYSDVRGAGNSSAPGSANASVIEPYAAGCGLPSDAAGTDIRNAHARITEKHRAVRNWFYNNRNLLKPTSSNRPSRRSTKISKIFYELCEIGSFFFSERLYWIPSRDERRIENRTAAHTARRTAATKPEICKWIRTPKRLAPPLLRANPRRRRKPRPSVPRRKRLRRNPLPSASRSRRRPTVPRLRRFAQSWGWKRSLPAASSAPRSSIGTVTASVGTSTPSSWKRRRKSSPRKAETARPPGRVRPQVISCADEAT
jgi:hypothetical protein